MHEDLVYMYFFCLAGQPYTMKRTFGKVPKYLSANKKMVALEKQQVAEFLQRQDPQVCSICNKLCVVCQMQWQA